MSFRVVVSAIGVGFFALAIAPSRQTAPQTAVLAGTKLAQTMQPTSPSSKTAKRKVKKKKQRNSGGGTVSPQPVPVGPPDPGKY